MLCLFKSREHSFFCASFRVGSAQTPAAKGQLLSCLTVDLDLPRVCVEDIGREMPWWLMAEAEISACTLLSTHKVAYGKQIAMFSFALLLPKCPRSTASWEVNK